MGWLDFRSHAPNFQRAGWPQMVGATLLRELFLIMTHNLSLGLLPSRRMVSRKE